MRKILSRVLAGKIAGPAPVIVLTAAALVLPDWAAIVAVVLAADAA